MEFGKVGLQHILAISGFHFALAALFLHFLFRLLLPNRLRPLFLIAALSLYYLFLGDAPSIQRAYIAIVSVTAGSIFSLRTSGLNALGLGMLIEIILRPLTVTELSFQLTFLCTLAILLCYPLALRLMNTLLPRFSPSEALSLSLVDKHGYLLSSFLKKSLALNGAVHLITIPVLLHLFHKFPLLSIAYNLLFPAAISLTLLLLFAACLLTPLLPFLGHALHQLNNTWTSSLLTLISNPPALLDFSLRTKNISFACVVIFLCTCFLAAVLLEHRFRQTANSI
jgi:competence protein ComEC